MPEPSMVGQDIGSPPQNPVQRPYQRDPFEGAQVREGTGQAYTANLGFGRKLAPHQQAYLSDPFADIGSLPSIEYTRPEDNVLNRDLISNQVDSSGEAYAVPEDATRLDTYRQSGELTPENVSDVYSLTEDELPSYGIDIHRPNDHGAPADIVSGWNDADGDGYDDDGHAYGTHGAVNVQTAAGEQSITDVLNYADPTEADTLGGALRGGLERGLDYAESFAQPGTRTLASGEEFTSSPGGAVSAALPPGFGAVAALGGAISAANLNRVHGRIEEDPNYGTYYERGSIPGVRTPIATHEGFIPGTRVVSGNTDLIPGLTGGQDEIIDATEVDAYAQAAQAAEAQRQREAEIQRQLEADAALRAQALAAERAAAERERQRIAEEQSRRERQAAEEARREAERRENQRRANEELERQRQRDRDNERAQIQQGRAVTDSSGRAVRDSSGRIVTDRPSQRNDDGGGGGGDSCFAKHTPFMMADGTLKGVDEIKVGDEMMHGGRVYGIMQGDGTSGTWYDYFGVKVTGSHFVLEGRWVPVEESQYAQPLVTGYDTWYCVLNEKHRMIAFNDVIFTDFDAVDSVNDELEERLNAIR